MKKAFLMISAIILFFVLGTEAQCPDPNVTTPGFHPSANEFPCIERGVAYDETVQINIPGSFDTTILGQTLTVSIDSITVNSISGQPNGITYACTPPSCTFEGGEAGCVNFMGTTNDSTGQYNLSITVTAYVTIPPVPPIFPGGPQTLGPLDLSTLGFSYYLTVIEQGANCPNEPQFGVSISGNTNICEGESTTLTANVVNETGSVSYSWSNGGSGQSITVSPTTTTTYIVTATDSNSSVNASTSVTVGTAPIADFTATTNQLNASFDNTSSDANSYSWNFGDGQVGTDQDPTHTYTSGDTYDVTLIATGPCGSDTTTKSVTVMSTGIASAGMEDISVAVFPNPNNGVFDLTLTSEDNLGDLTVAIYDLQGKMVYSEVMTEGSNRLQKRLDLTNVSKGIYTIHMKSVKQQYIQKLVVY